MGSGQLPVSDCYTSSYLEGRPRVVHARGAGTFGTFKLYESASGMTKAGVLIDPPRTTPIFLRFYTVFGGRGVWIPFVM